MQIGIYNNTIITEKFFSKVDLGMISNIQEVDNKYPQEQLGQNCDDMINIIDLDDNGIFNETKYLRRQNRGAVKKEIADIEEWFRSYDRIVIEHARCERMGETCHHNISELDSLAMAKQARLSDLRRLL